MVWVALGWIGLVGMVAGCGGDKDTTSTSCTTVLISSYPEDGATDVYYRSVVDVVIGRAEPDAVLTVTDDAGAAVAGAVTHDDRRITFVPDVPFTAGATYHSHLEWSCEPSDATFTIATGLGEPVDGASLVGNTYILDLRQGRYVWPPNMADAMNQFLAAELLLTVDSYDTAGLHFTAGSASFDDAQDVCSATTAYTEPADYTADPYFEVHVDALSLEVVRDDFVMQDLVMSGTLAPGGDPIVGLALDGDLDCRSLVTELDVTDAGAVCNVFAAGFGIDCAECADGGGAFCIPLVVDNLTLDLAPYTMVDRSPSDIAVDPVCAE